ncbi:S8 family peptidase [Acuticoccus sp. I52.16.1]|uniref:S8 family peptidase n=1 Tax=Acuticoccus sp. I52.16.1 TaxID=2928472 RepID=UPI001FD115C6|nr:S8 family peptidase [Acuticoccus sp. I52.16.1]UOM36699.1 S8 family peptidase [Acuticoccus sp. I52.16.1]
MAKLPHLFVRRKGRALRFQGIPPFVREERVPRTNRRQHVEALVAAVDAAAARSAARVAEQVLLPETDRGFYMSFEAPSETPMPLTFFESSRRGIDLLSVKVDHGRQTANVFMRAAKVDRFKSATEAYAESEPGVGQRPDNEQFFDRVDRIRPGRLEDLWTDPGNIPERDEPFAWELWLRPRTEDWIRDTAPEVDIRIERGNLQFPEAVVVRAHGTRRQIRRLVRRVPVVAELRAASSFMAHLLELAPSRQAATASALLQRIVAPGGDAPRVCVLDSGVRRAHPLLAPFIEAERCLTVNPAWNANDHHGHGTGMAGVALYENLAPLLASTDPVVLTYRLESVTVLPPAVPGVAQPLPGTSVREAVRLIERTARANRVYSLSMSAPRERSDGRPSSLSTVIDQLAFGRPGKQRLFVVPAGNIDEQPYQVDDHIALNDASPMRSPSQALNAVTVGACTHLVHGEWPAEHVAPEGDLSPTSRTGIAWHRPALCNKPDIVMEGGNRVADVDGIQTLHAPHLSIVTTARDFGAHRFSCTGETSAATAAASGLAASIMAAYPAATPQTVRALMVHSARWTPAMRQRLPARPSRGDYALLLQRYGFGKPARDRALNSLDNAMTMIIQDDIQVYRRGSSNSVALGEMKWHELPWPREVLEELGADEVRLRVTLSYFVEPNPSRSTRQQANRYASAKLRFVVKGIDDEVDDAIARVNRLARDGGYEPEDLDEDDRFEIGPANARRGSLHHDVWRGPASDLLHKGGIGVLPIKGWWGDRKRGDRWLRKLPYSLVISIETVDAETAAHIYQEVESLIAADILTEIETPTA